MKRRILALFVCLCMLAGSASGLTAYAYVPSNSTDVTVKIMHTNDIHARSSYEKNSIVGFEKLAALVSRENPDLLVDVGDIFHGQAFATLEQGESIAELMCAVGYDAMTPGNHDWNYGKDRLKQLAEKAQISVLAGNIEESGTAFFGNDGTLIKTVNGVKIGVLGVFDQDIKEDTAPRNIAGLTFDNDAVKATQLAQKLRSEGCDIVVALSHQLYCEAFVSQIKGIDILLAGHEHSVLDEIYTDADGNGVRVVETGSYFANVGMLSIVYNTQEKKIVSTQESLFSAKDAEGLVPDGQVSALLERIRDRQKNQLTRVVGTSGRALDGTWENLRVGETSLGRVVCAAYLDETGADISFENAGGIRLGKLLAPGEITYQDIINIAPFGNYIVTKQITGEAVLSILEKSIEIGVQNKKSYDEWIATGSDQVRWPDDNGSYLQFGGLTVSYDVGRAQGERVVSAKVGGEPIDPEKMYTVASNNYIALGKVYSELAAAPEINQYAACDEAIIRFVQKGQETVDNASGTLGLREIDVPVQELPAPETTPEAGPEMVPDAPAPSAPESGKTTSSFAAVPKTGDDGAFVYCTAAAAFSGALFIFLKKRNRYTSQQ